VVRECASAAAWLGVYRDWPPPTTSHHRGAVRGLRAPLQEAGPEIWAEISVQTPRARCRPWRPASASRRCCPFGAQVLASTGRPIGYDLRPRPGFHQCSPSRGVPASMRRCVNRPVWTAERAGLSAEWVFSERLLRSGAIGANPAGRACGTICWPWRTHRGPPPLSGCREVKLRLNCGADRPLASPGPILCR